MPNSHIITYPPPVGIPAADDYQVEVNGTSLFLYSAKVNFLRIPDKDLFPSRVPFAYFDMQGEVTVSVRAKQPISFVDIRPKSYGIEPMVEGDTVRFTMSQPRKLSIEFNGDLRQTLHLFANPLESDAPSPDDPSVMYFGPGVHNPGVITLESGKTVYIAGGAYVYGIVRGSGADNACVRGHGILSAEKAHWPHGGFQVEDCRSLTLRDFILLDSAGWSVKLDGCSEVLIENFKEICCRRNSDGIDLCSTQNAVVRDCFVRNWDDALCVKGLGKGDSRNIVFSDCVLWSDAAQSIEVGYETQMEKLENVLFQNIDILHHLMPGYMCITVHCGDRAAISNVRFEDIRIEDTVAPLFDIWVGKAHWNQDVHRGSIRGLHYKNISLTGGANPDEINRFKDVGSGQSELSYLAALTSRIAGYNADHCVEDVTFENINILGKTITSLEEGNFEVNEFVRGVQFLPPSGGEPILQISVESGVATHAPVTVTLDASQSVGQGAEIVSYAWSFGDGQSAAGSRVKHIYVQPGNYTAQLTVCDALDRRAEAVRIITILPFYESVSLDNPTPGLRYWFAEGDFHFGTDLRAVPALGEGTAAGITPIPHLRPDYHAVRYQGYLYVAEDGIYRFFVGMEFGTGYDMLAGGAVYLHDRLITENNGSWGQIGLQAGFHPIQVTLFRKSGGREVEFRYMGPGVANQKIPPEVFFIGG